MKVLFQGGWKAGRDPEDIRETIASYCRSLAVFIVTHGHTLVLTSGEDSNKLIATEVAIAAKAVSRNIKDHLVFLLPDRENAQPKEKLEGRVIQLSKSQWLVQERTEAVMYCDALVAIGGGREAFDCVEKGILSNKPVFVVNSIASLATQAWRARTFLYKYKFLTQKDAEALDGLNLTPNEFFEIVFAIIDRLADYTYSRPQWINISAPQAMGTRPSAISSGGASSVNQISALLYRDSELCYRLDQSLDERRSQGARRKAAASASRAKRKGEVFKGRDCETLLKHEGLAPVRLSIEPETGSGSL
jgi:hypothetical protein